LAEYFPVSRREKMRGQSVHFDPEFDAFTYGDPTKPKAVLRNLEADDLVLFYCGLHGADFRAELALYLIGYFDVLTAGKASDYDDGALRDLFGHNFHVRHSEIFAQQRDDLVLVKGAPTSRLLTRAVRISEMGSDRAGKPLKVLSEEARSRFGNFRGRYGIQRSTPRWVESDNVGLTSEYIHALP
jgi:hypothetical protein